MTGSSGPIIVLTGPPGAGKTTVAPQLADRYPRSVHLVADQFWEWIAERRALLAAYHRKMLDVVVVLAIIILIWVLYVGGIVAAARRPDYAYRAIGRRKPGTITLIVLTGFIGGTYFLVRIRPQLLRAEGEIPPDSVPPPEAGRSVAS